MAGFGWNYIDSLIDEFVVVFSLLIVTTLCSVDLCLLVKYVSHHVKFSRDGLVVCLDG